MKLSPKAEEVATFFAKMLDHEYTTKDIFRKNFFKDWRKVQIVSWKGWSAQFLTARPPTYQVFKSVAGSVGFCSKHLVVNGLSET